MLKELNIQTRLYLTYISLASFLRDTGKQYSPRCDAAECGIPSGAILFSLEKFIETVNKKSLLMPLKMKVNSPK